MNPAFRAALDLERVVARDEERFGSTPLDRMRLGITFGEARRSLADINDELDDEDADEFALPTDQGGEVTTAEIEYPQLRPVPHSPLPLGPFRLQDGEIVKFQTEGTRVIKFIERIASSRTARGSGNRSSSSTGRSNSSSTCSS